VQSTKPEVSGRENFYLSTTLAALILRMNATIPNEERSSFHFVAILFQCGIAQRKGKGLVSLHKMNIAPEKKNTSLLAIDSIVYNSGCFIISN
jgi:hypothetical protein